MLEKVARALAPTAWAALGTGDTLAQQNRRIASLRHARKAIEAMREPTERMRTEGESAASWGIGKPNDDEAIVKVWREMIDEALKS